MSELRSPVQAFLVRKRGPLSQQQIRALMQLYQPIIGLEAVNLYLVLAFQVTNEKLISNKKVHSALFTSMGGGLGKLDQARLALEAIGLVVTYKETKATDQYPTLIYDLQPPYLFEDFMQVPLLANALIHQLGDHYFYELAKEWQIQSIELADFEEVSVSFDTVFTKPSQDYQTVAEDLFKEIDLQSDQSKRPILDQTEAFDFSGLIKTLIPHQINHQNLGPKLKDEVTALYSLYGFTVEQVSRLILAAYDQSNQILDYQVLRMKAAQAAEGSQVSQDESRSKTRDLPNRSQVVERAQSHLNQDPQTKQVQDQSNDTSSQSPSWLSTLKEHRPLEVITQIKLNMNGFVSSQEIRNIQALIQISKLPEPVINLLIYYLLVIKGRPDFQKGESQRLANEWQQEGLDQVDKVLAYLKKQNQDQAQKQGQSRNKGSYYRSKRQETRPYWLNDLAQSGQASTNRQVPQASIEPQQDQRELRDRMKRVFDKGSGNE